MIKQIFYTLLLSFITIQIPAQCWDTIVGKNNSTFAIKTDGSLWGWGSNSEGQLGNGTKIRREIPGKIGSSNDWAMVSVGIGHVVAIKKDGSLWAWGRNSYGQLGDGSTIEKLTPTRIGNDTDWKNVSAGGFNTTATKNDGSLWAWGVGMLGDGTTNGKNVPTRIGTGFDWQNTSGGSSFTIALKQDGSLWGWGENTYGQLGDGTNTNKLFPTRIGLSNDWKTISAGGSYTVALKNDGSLWTCGSNSDCQLGDGTIINKNLITRVGADTDWEVISGGISHTMAIKKDGSLWGWGNNGNRQLGLDFYITRASSPTRAGSSYDWKVVSANVYSTVALKINNSYWGWGSNYSGQLGDNTTIDKSKPTQITGPCSALSISDINKLKVTIYPNPAKDYFSVSRKDIKQVQLYSLDGKLIKKYLGFDKYSVNGLAKGIYIIKIQLENGNVVSEKIVKD